MFYKGCTSDVERRESHHWVTIIQLQDNCTTIPHLLSSTKYINTNTETENHQTQEQKTQSVHKELESGIQSDLLISPEFNVFVG